MSYNTVSSLMDLDVVWPTPQRKGKSEGQTAAKPSVPCCHLVMTNKKLGGLEILPFVTLLRSLLLSVYISTFARGEGTENNVAQKRHRIKNASQQQQKNELYLNFFSKDDV